MRMNVRGIFCIVWSAEKNPSKCGKKAFELLWAARKFKRAYANFYLTKEVSTANFLDGRTGAGDHVR